MQEKQTGAHTRQLQNVFDLSIIDFSLKKVILFSKNRFLHMSLF